MNILTEFKTWPEAERWLAKHGYGIEQIRLEKVKWDEANPAPIKATEPAAKPEPVKAAAPVAKVTKAPQTKVVTESQAK